MSLNWNIEHHKIRFRLLLPKIDQGRLLGSVVSGEKGLVASYGRFGLGHVRIHISWNATALVFIWNKFFQEETVWNV